MSKNKTLYISDLDGTLLNRNAELSLYTKDTLNRMIADGLCFAVKIAVENANPEVTKLIILPHCPARSHAFPVSHRLRLPTGTD